MYNYNQTPTPSVHFKENLNTIKQILENQEKFTLFEKHFNQNKKINIETYRNHLIIKAVDRNITLEDDINPLKFLLEHYYEFCEYRKRDTLNINTAREFATVLIDTRESTREQTIKLFNDTEFEQWESFDEDLKLPSTKTKTKQVDYYKNLATNLKNSIKTIKI